MAVRLSFNAAAVSLNARAALVDGGDLRIRSGAQPANGDDAATGTLLATFSLPVDVFPAATDANPGALITAVAITATTGVADDNAGYYEVRNSVGAVQWTGTVSASGGGGDLQIDPIAITTGQPVEITSWTHTQLEQ